MKEIENQNIKQLQNYILCPNISIHDPLPCVIPRKFDESRLFNLPGCPATTKLVQKRDFISGKVIDFIETEVEQVGAMANNSMSMRREPGLLEEVTRGSAMNFPFWPGGLDEPQKEIKQIKCDDFNFDIELLTIPPGFSRGYEFKESSRPTKSTSNNINLLSNLEKETDVQEWLKLTKEEEKAKDWESNSNEFKHSIHDDKLLEVDFGPVLDISTVTTNRNAKTEWAESVDISQPIKDFKEKIPKPALEYPFELDVFQKQAILKLEEGKDVFVAAHTSAGKTVVAEYAIALSQRNMTRTIYTSPIKALSNQKYRDFKETFADVGLITGDLQIEPTATCLIMTTEILRSMLYCGSDITRDLEYVILDEVHYINNPERGHVWEEVIILLPDHVRIIMLSATVPNTMELANWVGSTKKRMVYVISTLKRPVPLMHYLYTGSGGKSKNDIFLIVDANGNLLEDGYSKAVLKKKETTSSKPKGGPGGGKQGGAKQDQNLWVGLIDFLKRNNKMPVVAFTLSRKRCDTNAMALQSCDLNTAREKGAVQKFFQQCLMKLKPPDRMLPQVLTIKDSLERGIGVHHSGILPILKEIVELLFQSGLVKLLFATETFAMGVNMPARTVIFDSHRKFDGMEVRNLGPGEYIQMAGRAGRRGHDENGTVILLCKQDVPPVMDLRSMILGRPEKLESQFLLRYSVILTCLRIESIKVEDIMQFSFKEFNMKQQIPAQAKQLKMAEDKFALMPELGEHLKPLVKFYVIASEYIEQKSSLMKSLMSQPKIMKEVKVGRVLMVTQGRHYNKLGILLSIKSVVGKETVYKVLVLDHNQVFESREALNRGEKFNKLISLTPQNRFFQPDGIGGHTILDIKAGDIIEITKSNMKVDPDAIIHNWEQRQIERFRDSPPSTSVIKAVSELQLLNNNYIANPDSVKFINLTSEVNVSAGCEMAEIRLIEHLWSKLSEILPHTNIAGFEQEFSAVYDKKILERRIEDLKFMNSTKSLSLYPDYCNKLKVLRALRYIDELDEVTLKGKVACEMGSNELLITELILCNMFNDLEPAEIAALLSGLVFQAKIQGEPIIPERLKKCVKEFEEINDIILKEELKNQAVMETENRLNFGLVEVVYEWARNKPFAEIMELTEVQEGIIVRCIQQLDETLRDVKTAAIRIGNPALQSKMEEASNAIKRDIVFTASLYTAL
ncbi:SKI2 subunit of superkiller complex protein [Episyrphus balteatus]|uniref:SKI2 subunit of superkiller complex protein n=1 Tax=Episyrphus balteatus TaxID=286459 RepID=UPI002485687C|nr:SKI2 subunit of superkiller complex protein [Episyrphus balteatus]